MMLQCKLLKIWGSVVVPPTRIERATNGLGILDSPTEPTQQEPIYQTNEDLEKD
jgi:hypothetical protein